jgi:CO/xanthine dehydrogenase Mo-binding subunit
VSNFEPPSGMGDAGTSAIVPAVANAIFAGNWQAPEKDAS